MKKTILFAVSFFAAGAVWAQQAGTQAVNAGSVPIEEYVPKVIIEGKWGTGPGEFGLGTAMGLEGDNVIPDEIVLDDAGDIYVLDKWNNRIQRFDSTGKYADSYALDIYVCPTDEEYIKASKTWNKRMGNFRKIIAGKLAWVDGRLYVSQKRMLDISAGKYQDWVLVLKSGVFVETSKKERNQYERLAKNVGVTKTGERFRLEDGSLKKFNQQGRKTFEHKLWQNHKFGLRHLTFASFPALSRNEECFYEMKVFSLDSDDWSLVFLPDRGGMRVMKWCKK